MQLEIPEFKLNALFSTGDKGQREVRASRYAHRLPGIAGCQWRPSPYSCENVEARADGSRSTRLGIYALHGLWQAAAFCGYDMIMDRPQSAASPWRVLLPGRHRRPAIEVTSDRDWHATKKELTDESISSARRRRR